MSDVKPFEITVIVKDDKEGAVEHYEAPLSHQTVRDVLADLKGVLNSRSGNRVREIDPAR